MNNFDDNLIIECHCNLDVLEEEVPCYISCICESSLCDLCTYRVDDCRLLLVLEQVTDSAPCDELYQEH